MGTGEPQECSQSLGIPTGEGNKTVITAELQGLESEALQLTQEGGQGLSQAAEECRAVAASRSSPSPRDPCSSLRARARLLPKGQARLSQLP